MKTPERRQASSGVVGEQLTLIDPPLFSPLWPKRATHAARALEMLIAGREITHPDFQIQTRSWRLGAYVEVLRKLGWPVVTMEIPSPTPDCPARFIARYVLPEYVIAEIGGRHARP